MPEQRQQGPSERPRPEEAGGGDVWSGGRPPGREGIGEPGSHVPSDPKTPTVSSSDLPPSEKIGGPPGRPTE
jgi:hypothetical protein